MSVWFSLLQTQLIDPAVKGSLNVLKSCAKSPSVKRIVFTSSIATALYNGTPRTPDIVVDETWFSNLDLLWEQKVLPFSLNLFSVMNVKYSAMQVEHVIYKHVIENRHATVSLSVSYNNAHVMCIFLTLIYISDVVSICKGFS